MYSKLTSHNNLVLLEFDFGRWFWLMWCTMRVRGPLWEHSVELWFTDVYQYQIGSPDIVERATDNAVAVAGWLEERFVRPLEAMYGAAPAWFRYFV